MQQPPSDPGAYRPPPQPGYLPPPAHGMPRSKKPMGSLGRSLIVVGIFLVGCFVAGAVGAVRKKLGANPASSAAPDLAKEKKNAVETSPAK
jgi:hypothetical protein